MKTRISLATLLAVTMLMPFGAMSQHAVRPSWPNQNGGSVFVTASSEAIPAFPHDLSGYRSEEGKDFWDKPFPVRGTMRVFQGKGWRGIPNFPSTINGCSSGVFMMRWRSSDPTVQIQSSPRFSSTVPAKETKTGAFGYMSGTNCQQPMFNFGDKPASDGSTLVDVYYELKFWQAAP